MKRETKKKETEDVVLRDYKRQKKKKETMITLKRKEH